MDGYTDPRNRLMASSCKGSPFKRNCIIGKSDCCMATPIVSPSCNSVIDLINAVPLSILDESSITTTTTTTKNPYVICYTIDFIRF